MQRVALMLFVSLAQALHFYASPGESRCFYEELPKNALVVAHFESTVKAGATGQYLASPDLKMTISVDETFDNDHRVVLQTSPAEGEFTFSALDTGEHRFCLTPVYKEKKASVRVLFDLVQLGPEVIDSQMKDTVSLLTNKVKEINNRLHEIKVEQQLVRERESSFRDQSESTNGKVMIWSVFQLGALGLTCFWQLTHLKTFFVKQKVL